MELPPPTWLTEQFSGHDEVGWVAPDGRQWVLALEWGEVSGRAEVLGFGIRSADGMTPVTSTALRSVPLGRVVEDQLRRRLADARGAAERQPAPPRRHHGEFPSGRRFAVDVTDESPGIAAHQIGPLAAAGERLGRPRTYGKAHFQAVAGVYSKAWEAGLHPTKAVAERFQVSRSAAAKWVARAREMQLLGPTRQRRAGGVQ